MLNDVLEFVGHTRQGNRGNPVFLPHHALSGTQGIVQLLSIIGQIGLSQIHGAGFSASVTKPIANLLLYFRVSN